MESYKPTNLTLCLTAVIGQVVLPA